jgi:hypothetical protein
LWAGSATKFEDLQFAMCGSIKRNLRTHISQKFSDLQLQTEPKNLQIYKKQLCGYLCKFATSVNNTGGKLPEVENLMALSL